MCVWLFVCLFVCLFRWGTPEHTLVEQVCVCTSATHSTATCVCACVCVCAPQVCISRLLITLDKPDAAEALLLDTFERALTSMSVQDLHLQEIPKALHQLLNAQGRTQEAEALKERATSLGIDASGCEPGCTCHVHLAQYLKMSKEEKAKYDARKRATMAQFAKLMREQQSAESLEALAMHESMV